MYTVETLTKLLGCHEYNIRTKSGLERIKGYTAQIACADKDVTLDSIAIGVHKGKRGYWVVDDLESGLAITPTQVYKTRRDALDAFLTRYYQAYSRLCIERNRDRILAGKIGD